MHTLTPPRPSSAAGHGPPRGGSPPPVTAGAVPARTFPSLSLSPHWRGGRPLSPAGGLAWPGCPLRAWETKRGARPPSPAEIAHGGRVRGGDVRPLPCVGGWGVAERGRAGCAARAPPAAPYHPPLPVTRGCPMGHPEVERRVPPPPRADERAHHCRRSLQTPGFRHGRCACAWVSGPSRQRRARPSPPPPPPPARHCDDNKNDSCGEKRLVCV